MTQQFHSQVNMRELRTCPHRNLSMNVNSSGIQNSQKMETVQGSIIPLMSCRNLYFTFFSSQGKCKDLLQGNTLSSYSRLLMKVPEQCVGDNIELSYFSPSGIFSPLGPGTLRWRLEVESYSKVHHFPR